MKVLQIKDLKFSYDKKNTIFSGLSFDVLEGEYVSLIGHNGSGKSTLAKLIIGLLEASEGQIIVFDELLTEESVYRIRQNVGIIFQNPDNQFIGSTVEDDIAFGLENHLVPTSKMDGIILEYATKVGMEEFLKKEPTSLSGGQKQRVAIAGVLAMKPKLIIMDESTSMLDPKGKREITELILRLRKEDPTLTILSITHDIEEAYLSDRVIVMNKGKIMFNDSPLNVFKHEEELLEMDLDIPFVYKLKKELERNNINVYSNEEKEMVKELCQ